MSKWEKVGVVGVDAGIVWVGDPCYLYDKRERAAMGETYEDFLATLRDREVDGVAQFNYGQTRRPGLGVALYTANGDGLYPLEVRRDIAGRVVEMRVRFEEK
jgi:hypothetical protein